MPQFFKIKIIESKFYSNEYISCSLAFLNTPTAPVIRNNNSYYSTPTTELIYRKKKYKHLSNAKIRGAD